MDFFVHQSTDPHVLPVLALESYRDFARSRQLVVFVGVGIGIALRIVTMEKPSRWLLMIVFLVLAAACQPTKKADSTSTPRLTKADLPAVLVDRNGKNISLKAYVGKPVVLVVVRGMPESPGGKYCPFCLSQATSLTAKYDEFKNRGAEVLMVFPGTSESASEFAKQVSAQDEAGKPIPFTVCVDQDCTVCDQLGIRGDLAKPSTFILDREGELVYAYVGKSTSDRPTLATIFKELDQLQK
jgi:peroxiredoxin